MQIEETKLLNQKKLEEVREEEKNDQEFIEKKEVKRTKAWLDFLKDNPAII